MLKLTGYLNLERLEEALASAYKDSIRARALEVDLSTVKWLSPLAICTLYSWVYDIISAKGRVTFALPAGPTFARSFLDKCRFVSALTTAGVDVANEEPSRPSFAMRSLAAFEVFPSRAALGTYLARLNDVSQRRVLLGFADPPDIVDTGHFHALVLRELIENTFEHGQGRNSHYAVFEARDTERRRLHPLFAGLGGSGYVEVCVGDSSPHDLYDTIRHTVPDDYVPDALVDSYSGRLDSVERAVAWAFEFASTSKPDRRRAALTRLLDNPIAANLATPHVATGLYNVRQIARAYKGQLIFRVAGRLGTLDFSRDSERPRLAFWRRVQGRSLARLKGTLLLLRVPTTGYRQISVTGEPASAPQPERPVQPSITVIAPATLGEADELVKLEQDIKAALDARQRSPAVVILVLDGARLETKLLGVVLHLIANIPRRSAALVALVSDPRMLDAARDQWKRVQERWADFALYPQRPPSYAVALDEQTIPTHYGDPNQVGATHATDDALWADGWPGYVRLRQLVADARAERLRRSVVVPPVRHVAQSDELILMPGAYYVREFFEIPALLQDDATRATLQLWIVHHLRSEQPAVVVNFSQAVGVLWEVALKLLPENIRPSLLTYTGESMPSLTLQAAVAAAPDRPILLYTDVLCTGRDIKPFLGAIPYPRRAVVLTAVDARADEPPYLPLRLSTGSLDVPVRRLLQHPVMPIRRKPPEVLATKVIVVDVATSKLTRYALPGAASLPEDLLLARAERRGAVLAGHFAHAERHYVYLLDFQQLFGELDTEIAGWLIGEKREFETDTLVPPAATVVLTLDEGTGLAQQVERATRNDRFKRVGLLSRDELETLPARGEQVDGVWFIMPAMDTGRTLRTALQYAQVLRAKKVHVSVVTARATPDLLAFYQGVSAYADIQVTVHAAFSLPLPSFAPGECPSCQMSLEIAPAVARAEPYPALSDLLREATRALDVHVVDSLSAVTAPAEFGPDGVSVADEVTLQSLYIRGTGRDIDARRRLEDKLKSVQAALSFARSVGRAPETGHAATRRRRDVLYGSDPFGDACQAWVRGGPTEGAALAYLRGFALVAPQKLKEVLPQLFKAALTARSSALLKGLALEALRDPELYWEAVDDTVSYSSDALRELRQLLRQSTRTVVGPIIDLHEHLARSYGWGNNVELLKLFLLASAPAWPVIQPQAERFFSEGVEEAQRLWQVASRIRAFERLPSQIRTEWVALREATAGLRADLQRSDHDGGHVEAVLVQLEGIESASRVLRQRLLELATRPEDILGEFRQLGGGSRYDVAFDCVVDAQCPAIVMAAHDFRELVGVVLENSRERQRGAVRLEFRPGDSGLSSVEMIVSDTAPWLPSEGVEGGLRRVRQICSYYGARLYLPTQATPSEAHRGGDTLRLLFPAWPPRSRGV